MKRGNLAHSISRGTERPSPAALALATSIDMNTFADLNLHALMIDAAFDKAIEAARKEERERIFGMGFAAIVKEFWKGRKLYSK